MNLDLQQFLPYQLATLSSEVSQALARAYGEPFGLSIPEWRVMAVLGQGASRQELMTAKDICRISRMHKTTVSRAAAGLEARDYLLRRAGVEDMRETYLALSTEGLRAYADIVPIVRAVAEKLEAVLTRDEQQQLSNLLSKLARRSSELLAA